MQHQEPRHISALHSMLGSSGEPCSIGWGRLTPGMPSHSQKELKVADTHPGQVDDGDGPEGTDTATSSDNDNEHIDTSDIRPMNDAQA